MIEPDSFDEWFEAVRFALSSFQCQTMAGLFAPSPSDAEVGDFIENMNYFLSK